MKNIFAFLLLLSITGCAITQPAITPEDSILVTIEYRNDPLLQQQILQRLRQVNARDVTVNEYGAFLSIRAACYIINTSMDKLATVTGDISKMPGVLTVLAERNTTAVKQSLYISPQPGF